MGFGQQPSLPNIQPADELSTPWPLWSSCKGRNVALPWQTTPRPKGSEGKQSHTSFRLSGAPPHPVHKKLFPAHRKYRHKGRMKENSDSPPVRFSLLTFCFVSSHGFVSRPNIYTEILLPLVILGRILILSHDYLYFLQVIWSEPRPLHTPAQLSTIEL